VFPCQSVSAGTKQTLSRFYCASLEERRFAGTSYIRFVTCLVRVNFPRKQASKEIRTVPYMSCNRTKEDWAHKTWMPRSETDYQGSNANQKKIDQQRKKRQESHAVVKISYQQDCW